MADAKLWWDEVRFIMAGPQGTGPIDVYALNRTDDHFACPNTILGWYHRRMEVPNLPALLDILNREIEADPMDCPGTSEKWTRKAPPENEYGAEMMAVLEANDRRMEQLLEDIAAQTRATHVPYYQPEEN